ncbi:MAG TPA: CDC27 family protein [Opitutaceae bacterium]|nr:CDC27 family protein [Opitutaceae bacterium]
MSRNGSKSFTHVSPGMRDVAACGFLGLLVVSIYAQVGGHRPIAFDDALYLTDNARVLAGLTWDSVVWAFTNVDAANWHPLTWLSHMVDQQLFKSNWGGHMIENVFWHAANSMLLYALFRRLGFARTTAFSLAALFACHPLNVESVAWLSQRKNQLSTFLLLCAVIVYLDWRRERRTFSFVLLILAFAMSLMAKAMGVTLPVIILVFEAVSAFQGSSEARFNTKAVTSKWLCQILGRVYPLVLVSIAMCAATIMAQRHLGAVASLETFSYTDRLANATQAVGVYLKTFIWPTDLSFFYPLRENVDWGLIAIALTFIVGVLCASIYHLKKIPLLAFGASWFLISLLPVIGLVQVGSQSHADRYMYVPMIGLLIMLGAIAEWLSRENRLRIEISSIAVASFAVLLGIHAYAYTMLWRNGETAYRNAISVGGHSYTMTVSLTATLINLNYLKTAEPYAKLAAERWPERPLSVANLATLYARREQYIEAEHWFRKAVEIEPGNLRFRYMLGLTLLHLNRGDEAERVLQSALGLVNSNSTWRTSDQFAKSVLLREVNIQQSEIKDLMQKADPKEVKEDTSPEMSPLSHGLTIDGIKSS